MYKIIYTKAYIYVCNINISIHACIFKLLYKYTHI